MSIRTSVGQDAGSANRGCPAVPSDVVVKCGLRTNVVLSIAQQDKLRVVILPRDRDIVVRRLVHCVQEADTNVRLAMSADQLTPLSLLVATNLEVTSSTGIIGTRGITF